jgi:CO/xanthine dehydrogenase FAD-binding subunit
VVGVGCVVNIDGKGRASALRLAACGIADRPVRLNAAEAILNGTALGASELDQAVAASASVVTQPDEMTVSASYRRRALGTLICRTVAVAARRARERTLQ